MCKWGGISRLEDLQDRAKMDKSSVVARARLDGGLEGGRLC